METKAIIFPEPKKAEISTIDVPDPGPGEVLTRTLYTGVSTGTETRVFIGRQDNAVFPLIPGYENLGEVVKTGDGVDLKPGQRFLLTDQQAVGKYNRSWGAQVGHGLSKAETLIPLPEGVDPVMALFSKVCAIGLHGIDRGKIRAGETVAIAGQGLIGHMATQYAKSLGAKVIAIDMIEERLDTARKVGVDHTLNPAKVDVKEEIRKLTDGGVDVAIDVTGVAATVNDTIQLIKQKPWNDPVTPSARFVLLGSYADRICFDYHEAFFFNEVDFFASRDCTVADMKKALELIAAGKIDPSLIPAEVVPYTDAPNAYHRLLERKATRVIYKWT